MTEESVEAFTLAMSFVALAILRFERHKLEGLVVWRLGRMRAFSEGQVSEAHMHIAS